MAGALGHIRVLDLATELGWYCGKLFAGLGANVIRVEPVNGDPGRRVGPFAHGGDGDVSLFWEAGSAGKRSVAVDLESEDGREILRRLITNTDILIESFSPGFLESIGFSWDQLQHLNPQLVYVSITPYGASGPYSEFRASDLTLQAMGGLSWLCGDADRAPTRLGAPQSMIMAGAQGAIGAMLGYTEAVRNRRAVRVDVSAQEAITWGLIPTRQVWELSHMLIMRAGPARSFSDRRIQVIYQCADGHAAVFGVIGRELPTLIGWLDELGIEHDLHDEHWTQLGQAGTPAANQTDFDHVAGFIATLARRFEREEFAREAQQRRIIVYPVYGSIDLLSHSCLLEREFYEEITLANGQIARVPGAPFRFSETPWQVKAAPALGEHAAEVLGEVGYDDAAIERLQSATVVSVAPRTKEGAR